jgi:hypothetical protein
MHSNADVQDREGWMGPTLPEVDAPFRFQVELQAA